MLNGVCRSFLAISINDGTEEKMSKGSIHKAACALFTAFLTLSFAAVTLAADNVTSADIKEADGTSGQNTNTGSGVKTDHIQNGAVTTSKLAAGAVTTSALAAGAVASDKIAAGAVSDVNITGPISASKINSVGLDADTVDGNHAADFAAVGHNHDALYVNEGQANSISASMIIDGGITGSKIATGAVADLNITGPISGSKISGTVPSADRLDGMHASDFAAAAHTHYDLESRLATMEAAVATLQSSMVSATTRISTLEGNLAQAQDTISILQSELAQVQNNPALDLGPYVSIDMNAINGLGGPHVIFSGANIHIRSGAGSTDAQANGVGNVIVGYNEPSWNWTYGHRSGSHNVVIGRGNNYTNYGCLVSGQEHEVTGAYAAAIGGYGNQVGGSYSAAAGGSSNNALGNYSFLGGGQANQSSSPAMWSALVGGLRNRSDGSHSSVVAGSDNTASGMFSLIGGGTHNQSAGRYASVSGGGFNSASGQASSVTGGAYNAAEGASSSVSGGYQRSATGTYNWAAGTLLELQ
jgi:hypothetical protein